MKLRLLLLSFVSLALAVGAGWYIYRSIGVSSSAPEAAAQAARQATQASDDSMVVVVKPDAQHASRIEVTPLAATHVRPERTAYAAVVDLRAFFDLRSRLAAARAGLDGLRAQAGSSRAQYERDRALFKDNHNVSQKALQDAQALMRVDKAKLQSAQAMYNGLGATLRQQFGDTLARAATASDSALAQNLLEGRAAVLLVTLPPDFGEAAPQRISIDAPGGTVAANLLSASPQDDPAIPGIPYFYAAESALPAGMRTVAHVPTMGPGSSALLIPREAIVWYGGQSWAYVRTEPDRFTRRYVSTKNPDARGYAVASGFQAGDLVVTQGAQLLLSREMQPQGITTACKDPPECDD